MTSRHIRISGLIAVLIAAPLASPLVAQQTSGAVRGQVKAKKGGIVANAGLVLRSAATGFSRTVVSDAQGNYQFNLMPVGVYELSITAPSMRTLRNSNVTVSLGQTTVLNFTMDSAEASTTVEVVAMASNLDSQQVNTITAVDEKLVQSIPLNGRNFTDLALLTPGAVDGGNGVISVEGARGIQNNLQIDGASFNSNFFGEQRGSTRIPFTFSADSIKELQIITNAFDAQYGNAAGAIINAITKSGTNETAGSVFMQIRPSSMVASVTPVPYDNRAGQVGSANSPQSLNRNFSQIQGNFTIGGPIIKDKLHYFVSVETQHYKEDVTPGFVLTSSNGTQADLDTFLQKFGNIAVGGGTLLKDENGRTYTNDRKNTVYMGRLDWTINENERMVFRVNSQNFHADNQTTTGTGALLIFGSNNGVEEDRSLSWVLELNSILTPNLVNEARLQFAQERRPRFPNSTTASELFISGGFSAGQRNYLPNGLDEFSTQVIDNLTWFHDDWTLKAGVDLQNFSFANTFYRYQYGAWSFPSYTAANTWANGGPTSSTSVSYTQSLSNFGGRIDYDSKLWAGYIQAQYRGLLDKRLTLNLGVRYTKETQPDNPRPNPQLAGTDQCNSTNSTDPRFGFTYDLTGKGNTILRGGYGFFSTPDPSQTVSNTMNSNGLTTSTYVLKGGANFNTGGLLSYTARTGGGIRLTPLSSSELLSIASAGTLSAQLWDPNGKMTQARRASLSLEHRYDNGLELAVRANYAKLLNLQYYVPINLRQLNADGSVNPNGTYNDGYPTTVNRFSNSTANRPGFAIVRGRRLTFTGAYAFGDVFLSRTDGEGSYKSLTFEAKQINPKGWGYQSSITFSKAEDNNSNERITASSNSASSVSINPGDPLSLTAPSDNDRKVRIVGAGFFPVYWGIQGSVIASYTSGSPYTATNTSINTPFTSGDLNGDGAASNDLAPGHTRNDMRQPSVKHLDLRFNRVFKIAKRFEVEGIIDIFNVFNWANQNTSLTTATRGNTTAGFTPATDFGFINTPDRSTREVQFGIRFKF